MKMLNDNVLVALMEDEKEERTTAINITVKGNQGHIIKADKIKAVL